MGQILLIIFIFSCTKPDPSNTYRPLIGKYIEYWNTGDFFEIETILHPEFELRMTPNFDAEKGI